MEKFKAAGTTVTRLSQEDLQEFRRAAIPVWYRWADKNEDAREIFDMQLEYMMNDTVGYITEDDIKGMK
jgi:TRAP-type C4-dicarboxylate transport system substrate-binding protein